jgi:hypothetical protein
MALHYFRSQESGEVCVYDRRNDRHAVCGRPLVAGHDWRHPGPQTCVRCIAAMLSIGTGLSITVREPDPPTGGPTR